MGNGIALVTGASGFVGSRLAPALAGSGWTVRAASRDPASARRRAPSLDWVHLDVHAPDSLEPALAGCHVAFYLVHSLKGAQEGYEARERADAMRFRQAAESVGVGRIVYLGGLAPVGGPPSRHLAGRLAVGDVLRGGRIPCLELRASMIIGAESASFRMLRDLAARLPAMVLPRWLDTKTEPVAIDDVVAALVAAAEVELPASAVYDLDGPEILTCREIIMRVAAGLGVSPRILDVPVLTPRLSSWWIRFVSGVDVPMARELVDGLRFDLVASRRGFREMAGLSAPIPFDEAVRRALAEEHPQRQDGSVVHLWERIVPWLSPRRGGVSGR